MKDNEIFLSALENFLNRYLPDTKGTSANTQRSYRDAFRLLFRFLIDEKKIQAGKIGYDSLDYQTLSDFLDWLQSGRKCASATRNQRLAALSSFSLYSQLVNPTESLAFRRAVLQIPHKKSTEKSPVFFTKEEMKVLFSLPDRTTKIGRRDYAILSFMYASGARAQEVCDLRRKNITFGKDKTTVTLTGKGGKARRIGIPAVVGKIVEKYFVSTGKGNEDYVFSSQTHGHMTVSCIEEIYKKYIELARKRNPGLFRLEYSPHSMRHTTATHMVEAGIPMTVIKNFLGHSSVQTTLIYATVTQEKMDEEIKEWNRRWLASYDEARKDDTIPSFLG